jgi:hypothetical protein
MVLGVLGKKFQEKSFYASDNSFKRHGNRLNRFHEISKFSQNSKNVPKTMPKLLKLPQISLKRTGLPEFAHLKMETPNGMPEVDPTTPIVPEDEYPDQELRAFLRQEWPHYRTHYILGESRLVEMYCVRIKEMSHDLISSHLKAIHSRQRRTYKVFLQCFFSIFKLFFPF